MRRKLAVGQHNCDFSRGVERVMSSLADLTDFRSKLRRWGEKETAGLVAIREKMGSLLTDCPQFPEAVGDRKLLRFFKGVCHTFHSSYFVSSLAHIFKLSCCTHTQDMGTMWIKHVKC